MKRLTTILGLAALLALPAMALGSGARVTLPTGYTTNPQFKPYLITVTGDGSAFFGGRTGRKVVPPTERRRFGRLDWTDYSATSANGVEWVKFGPETTAEESFKIDGTVDLQAYRPRSGVFTIHPVVSGRTGGVGD